MEIGWRIPSRENTGRVMQGQQRLEGRSFAVMVLPAINWLVIQPRIETIALAVDAAMPATTRMIDCGEFIRGVKRDKG